MGAQNSPGIQPRCQGSAVNYARKNPPELRRRSKAFSGNDGLHGRQTWAAPLPVRVLQQNRVQERQGIPGASRTVSKETAEGISLRVRNSQQAVADSGVLRPTARSQGGLRTD